MSDYFPHFAVLGLQFLAIMSSGTDHLSLVKATAASSTVSHPFEIGKRYPLKLSAETAKTLTIQYNFKPSTIDPEGEGTIKFLEDGTVKISHANRNGDFGDSAATTNPSNARSNFIGHNSTATAAAMSSTVEDAVIFFENGVFTLKPIDISVLNARHILPDPSSSSAFSSSSSSSSSSLTGTKRSRAQPVNKFSAAATVRMVKDRNKMVLKERERKEKLMQIAAKRAADDKETSENKMMEQIPVSEQVNKLDTVAKEEGVDAVVKVGLPIAQNLGEQKVAPDEITCTENSSENDR